MTTEEMVRVLQILSDKLDPNIPLHTALTFVTIAAEAQSNDGRADMHVVGKLLGMKSAALSRDVGILSEFSRAHNGGGLEVVKGLIDAADRRRRRLALTRKGELLVKELCGVETKSKDQPKVA